MTPTTFLREANYLFSNSYLNSIPNERPETVASQKLHRKFKAFLKSQFPDCEVTLIKGGYCEASAFLTKDDKTVYVSLSDLRYWKNWASDILVRRAKDTQDYRGYENHTATLVNLKSQVEKLFELNY